MIKTALATTIDRQLDQLRDQYRFRGEIDVADYLGRHPTTVPLLVDARTRLRNYFGNDAAVLELFVDPETVTEPVTEPELYVLVQTRKSSRDALDQLHRFDNDWWLDRLAVANVPITVSLEHV